MRASKNYKTLTGLVITLGAFCLAGMAEASLWAVLLPRNGAGKTQVRPPGMEHSLRVQRVRPEDQYEAIAGRKTFEPVVRVVLRIRKRVGIGKFWCNSYQSLFSPEVFKSFMVQHDFVISLFIASRKLSFSEDVQYVHEKLLDPFCDETMLEVYYK